MHTTPVEFVCVSSEIPKLKKAAAQSQCVVVGRDKKWEVQQALTGAFVATVTASGVALADVILAELGKVHVGPGPASD